MKLNAKKGEREVKKLIRGKVVKNKVTSKIFDLVRGKDYKPPTVKCPACKKVLGASMYCPKCKQVFYGGWTK